MLYPIELWVLVEFTVPQVFCPTSSVENLARFSTILSTRLAVESW